MLSIGRSSYYDWLSRKSSCRDIANKQLDEKSSEIFVKHHGRYGVKRMTTELHALFSCWFTCSFSF